MRIAERGSRNGSEEEMRIAERGARNGSPKRLLAFFLRGILSDTRKRLPLMGDFYGLSDFRSAIRVPQSAFHPFRNPHFLFTSPPSGLRLR
jgi:hypothetical protein